MKFYSTVAILTIPLPTVQHVLEIGGQRTIHSSSPSTIKFERGVYDTKTLKHIISEDDQVAFLKKTELWGTTIFESPEPVKAVAEKKSQIVGSQAVDQVLVNRSALPINQKPKPSDETSKSDDGTVTPIPFASRNDLVAYLVNEKGVKAEDLKGKKADEIVTYAKEVHNIDVVLNKE
jgi:hypothetical protein